MLMDKKLIAVLFLIFVVVFSFGCKKQEVTETPEEELPKVVRPGEKAIVPNVAYSQVKNAPYDYNGLYLNLERSKYGDFDNGYFLNAIVIEKTNNILKLQTLNETLWVEVKPNTIYREYFESNESGKVRVMGEDHFNDIKQYDYLTLFVNVTLDGYLFTESILIYPTK